MGFGSERSNVCVGPGGIWKISILPTQFFCESKTTVKNKAYIKIFEGHGISLVTTMVYWYQTSYPPTVKITSTHAFSPPLSLIGEGPPYFLPAQW